ncbi:MAG: TetR/AcrR family transcriptional regulator [Pseudomonadota bacterium]
MALDKEEVRRRIVDLGHSLIAKGGSEALQARVIAKEVGISVGSIYNLVGDMDELHRLVKSELLDELGMVGSSAVQKLDDKNVVDLRLRLLALALAYFEFVERNQKQWAALLAFNRSTTSEATPDWYMVRLEMLFDIISDNLQETPLGSDPHKCKIAARALWSSVHGIVSNSFVGREDALLRESTLEQIDLLISVFVKGLSAD